MSVRAFSRRAFVKATTAAVAALAWCAPQNLLGAEETVQKRPPNIVLILADDLGYTDLGVYGSSFYETPNLDRLASQGVRFISAYAACPVCSPTRASLLTGQYPATVGLTDYLYGKARGKLIPADYVDHLPPATFTLAEGLKSAGYATWHVGKWHLGREPYFPERQGFDVNVAGSRRGSPNKTYFSPWNLENLENGDDGDYLTDKLADEAVELIRANKDKPFFLNFWSYAPHTPTQGPEDLVEKYRAKAKQLGLDVEPLEEGEPFPTESKKHLRLARRQIHSNPVYAAMVENLDTNVGRILAAVEEAGQADNTIVIFSSDNGGVSTAEGSATSNRPLREGKGWMYEGGIRVPLIVRWPAAAKGGATTDVPVTSPDLLPTLLEAAGVKPPTDAKVEGVSFLPLLKGDAGPAPDRPLFWHYPHYGNQGGRPASAIRAGDWKLIEFFEDNRLELYNLRNDLGEQHDLAAKEPDRVKELHAQLVAWREQVGAKLPKPNPDYAR